MFNKLIAGLALAVCVISAPAHALQIDSSGLNDAQIAQLKAQAAKIAAENHQAQVVTKDSIGNVTTLASTWGTQAAQAADGFAKAFTIAARELGVTVNEFLKTDAGKLTAALIVWKVAGAGIINFLFAFMFVAVGQIIAITIYRRLFLKGYEKVEYKRFFGMFEGTKMVRIPKGFSQLEKDGEWLALWMMLLVSIGSMLIGAVLV